MKFSRFALLLQLLFLSPISAATTIADFQFNNNLNSSDPGTSWTTTVLSSGGGVPTTLDGSEGQPAPALALTMGNINDPNFIDTDFYQFAVTPTVDIDLTSFSLDINKKSGGADVDFQLYSSEDFSAGSTLLGSGSISAQDTWTTFPIDLTGNTLTTETAFRVYLFTTGTFGPNEIKLDNLVLIGDPALAAIPEPSTALCGILGLFLALRRKRS